MPRAKTKADLLRDLETERAQLEAFLAPLSPAQQVAPGVVGDWSVKDVLAHLAEWARLTLGWWEAGRRGERPATPAPDLTWKQIPELNQRIFAQWRDVPLDAVWAAYRAAMDALRAAITSSSEDELFGRGVHAWTNTTTLGAYFVSAGPSHLNWARSEMRKGMKRIS